MRWRLGVGYVAEHTRCFSTSILTSASNDFLVLQHSFHFTFFHDNERTSGMKKYRWAIAGGLGTLITIILVRRWRKSHDAQDTLKTPLSPPHLAEFSETTDEMREVEKAEESADVVHPFLVVSPFLGLVFYDSEFSRWSLSRSGVWYDCTAADLSESSPSAIAEYVLDDDPERPRMNIIAEDLMMMTCSAEEYVLRARQGMPTELWEMNQLDVLDSSDASVVHSAPPHASSPPTMEESVGDGRYEGSMSTPFEHSGGVSSWAADTVDCYCCSYTEQSDSGIEQCVVNMVAVRRGVVVVLQLNCRNNDVQRCKHMDVFRRICQSTLRQLRSVECDIVARSTENFVQYGLPSPREAFPGVVLTLPVGLLQVLPSAHSVAQIIQMQINALSSQLYNGNHTDPVAGASATLVSGVVMLAFVEKRSKGSEETIETYLFQFQRKSLFALARTQLCFLDVGRRVAVCGREELLCLVIAVAGTQGAASERASRVCEMLQPQSQNRRFVQYAHGPSGVICSLHPFMNTATQSTLCTQYFGPFSFRAYPRGTSKNQPQLRISVREVRVGESLAFLQRQATKDYADQDIVRRPCMEGWTRLDAAVLDGEGNRFTEHVIILQHHKWFVHIVYCSPTTQNNAAINDELRRCLHFHTTPI